MPTVPSPSFSNALTHALHTLPATLYFSSTTPHRFFHLFTCFTAYIRRSFHKLPPKPLLVDFTHSSLFSTFCPCRNATGIEDVHPEEHFLCSAVIHQRQQTLSIGPARMKNTTVHQSPGKVSLETFRTWYLEMRGSIVEKQQVIHDKNVDTLFSV